MTKRSKKIGVLVEVAWEVCNQVGGIYTVIRSKIPTAMEAWGENYALVGPYISNEISAEFEPLPPDDSVFGEAVTRMREMGFGVYFGCWLVSGRPVTILFDLKTVIHDLDRIKYFYHENHHIRFDEHDYLMDQVLAFGYLVKTYFSILASIALEKDIRVHGHFHEWMAGAAIPDIRKEQMPVRTIFTTHATVLGRYLAMNDPCFYDHLPFLNWEYEADNFNVNAIARLERACTHGAHVFTTVSEVTGRECAHLLGRTPDHILPNGFNIERFGALHEVQNAHQTSKVMIEHFVMGHFFQTYSFDLDKTLFFFTSGRYEYRNKGYDLVLEALARLNWMLKREGAEETIVMFIITKRPVYSINPGVLNSRAVMEEIDRSCDFILKQVKERLFNYAASTPSDHKLPDLNELVDDYWKLRYRRTIRSWKSDELPCIITHNMVDDSKDEVLNFLRGANLINRKEDKVKFVYHPDFISSANPLFGMDYKDFVRGCHLGIFPSNYEPWGYTPLECLASGVATVSSDLAGFGDYAKSLEMADECHGLYVVERSKQDFHSSAEELAEILMRFVKKTRKDRIAMRNKSEDLAECFDWKNLYVEYEKAYEKTGDEMRIAVV